MGQPEIPPFGYFYCHHLCLELFPTKSQRNKSQETNIPWISSSFSILLEVKIFASRFFFSPMKRLVLFRLSALVATLHWFCAFVGPGSHLGGLKPRVTRRAEKDAFNKQILGKLNQKMPKLSFCFVLVFSFLCLFFFVLVFSFAFFCAFFCFFVFCFCFLFLCVLVFFLVWLLLMLFCFCGCVFFQKLLGIPAWNMAKEILAALWIWLPIFARLQERYQLSVFIAAVCIFCSLCSCIFPIISSNISKNLSLWWRFVWKRMNRYESY